MASHLKNTHQLQITADPSEHQPLQDVTEQNDLQQQQNHRRRFMIWPILTTVVVIGLLIAFLLRIITQKNREADQRMQKKVCEALAELVARRFKVPAHEAFSAISSADTQSRIYQWTKNELAQCRVIYTKSGSGPVVMTILIAWKDSQETKIEEEQLWDELPSTIREHFIRTQRPLSYDWNLPVPA